MTGRFVPSTTSVLINRIPNSKSDIIYFVSLFHAERLSVDQQYFTQRRRHDVYRMNNDSKCTIFMIVSDWPV